MLRSLFIASLVLGLLAGCAGPTRLAQRSESKLADGDMWRAWQLATRALDREPMNPRARAAAADAGRVIAGDWERRILALADADSVRAADQVLQFVDFRAGAARYATIAVSPPWTAVERALRRGAARTRYQEGVAALAAHRPKTAWGRFQDAGRYVPDYRDAGTLATRALSRAMTPVAILPFACADADPDFGADVADAWRDALTERLVAPRAHFTRVLGADAVNARLTVAEWRHMTRDDAVRLARRSGAVRLVWGSLGPIHAETHVHVFRDVVARRVTTTDADGHATVAWVDVPIEVVSRTRDIAVDVSYEVIAVRDGSSLAHHHAPLTSRARVVWTSCDPQGDVNDYALVSDAVRSADPVRAKEVDVRWQDVCGAGTTLPQVLAARHASRGDGGYDRGALGRFAAGAAFVFLQDLPPAGDLALEALRGAWGPLDQDLAQLDGADDVDLGVAESDNGR